MKILRGVSNLLRWNSSLEKEVRLLENDLDFITGMVKQPNSLHLNENFKALPVCFRGQKLFEADTSRTFSYGGNDVNYIIEDGKSYDIPVEVFNDCLLRNLKVSINQRNYTANGIYNHKVGFGYASSNVITATPTQGASQYSFMWNITDASSGRQLSDDLLADTFLLTNVGNGGLFKFDIPWYVKKNTQLTFTFRPIKALIQRDSTYNSYAWDDREAGKRKRDMTVRIEFHGTRLLGV